ncbi:GTPase-activating protein [Saitozyma sp. JCM 24511]|nr:GTPase-activating protein [Saitozyma sp. JCM 24511]
MATMTLSPSPSLSAMANGMIPGGPPLSSPTGSLASRRLTNRMTNRYSVTAMYSLAAEQDIEVEDDLARAQRRLRDLKSRISAQSKKNFVLERDVRYLDSRIALLIQNKIAADEKRQVAETLEELGEEDEGLWPDEKKMGQYANLFFLLQSEPRHVASLCRLVSLSEIDTLLQTVMFTLYGNQYEQREEHLLLTMFQSVLSAQFETTSEFGSLLRANTPVSRMMTTYTRRGPGQSYLKSVLADRINSLIEHKDLNLEINPLKVYEQMIQQIEDDTGSLPPSLPRGVPPEVAAANPDVQAIIVPRLTMLMEIANTFLATIIDSMETVPYGIRWICKQIRSLTRSRLTRGRVTVTVNAGRGVLRMGRSDGRWPLGLGAGRGVDGLESRAVRRNGRVAWPGQVAVSGDGNTRSTDVRVDWRAAAVAGLAGPVEEMDEGGVAKSPAESSRKYPEASDASICSLIGGFFFLRFINPAVVTPQAYMLVDGVPAKHPRRTLTLVARWAGRVRWDDVGTWGRLGREGGTNLARGLFVCERGRLEVVWDECGVMGAGGGGKARKKGTGRPASLRFAGWKKLIELSSTHLIAKMLQNLANKPSYSKEQYMMSLNPFVENNKARMNKFLNSLCEVGDFYESLELDQYMALSKKDLQINITLNELYNTHSLLMQHMDVLSPNDKHHLRILLDELGPAPPQVPRKENRSIELPLYSRWETPIQDLSTALMSDSVTQNDINYMEAKSIFVQLLRSMPHLADKRPVDLPSLAERAATSKDPVLVRRGIKVQNLLSELDQAGVVDRADNYKIMQDEVAAEMVHLGNTKEKVVLETRSLEAVYKTICDHNNYLRSQLEQYKAYLQNVRQTTAKDNKDKGIGGVGVVSVNGKERKEKKAAVLGPYRFTHSQFEKEGIIMESNVPENRRGNIYFNITSPTPGTFIIALHFKGREKPILEMDLKIDDLLEKQKDNQAMLDLEYVQLNVPKVLGLFNKLFSKRR